MPNKLPKFYQPDRQKSKIQQVLVANGCRETYTNSMLKTEVAAMFGENVVETLNPISGELTALRTSLLPNLLKVVAFNQNHKQEALSFFEMGHVFQKTEREDVLVKGYLEEEHLIIVRCGETQTASWNQVKQSADFFGLKGTLNLLATELRLQPLKFKSVEAILGSEVLFDVYSGKRKIGKIGILSQNIAKQFDIAISLHFAELKMEAILDLVEKQSAYKFISPAKFPKVDRDLAFVCNKEIPADDILQLISQTGGQLVKKVRLFDVYEGDRIAADKKSLAFGLELGADHTLTDKEIEQTINRIIQRVQKETGAVLR